jgi:hypothetical protein
VHIKYSDSNIPIEPIAFWCTQLEARQVAPQRISWLPNLAILSNMTVQRRRGTLMSTWQAILCGMMLSWTPSVVFLAWVVWKERIGTEDM